MRCQYVSNDFHARLSAKRKIYRYRIWSAPVLPPFEYRRAWHIAHNLDLKVLKKGAKHFAGTHNFAGFAANRAKSAGRMHPSGRQAEVRRTRTIYSVRVRQKGHCDTVDC